MWHRPLPSRSWCRGQPVVFDIGQVDAVFEVAPLSTTRKRVRSSDR